MTSETPEPAAAGPYLTSIHAVASTQPSEIAPCTAKAGLSRQPSPALWPEGVS